MLAVLKGTLGHGEVVVPVGGDIDEVDVRALAEFLIAFLARIDGSRGKAGFAEVGLTVLGTLCLIIAKGHNLHARDERETLYGTRASHAQTHEGHTYSFQFRCRESDDIRLSGRPTPGTGPPQPE